MSGLDLQVDEGRIHGFVGANGAGKTTTIRMLLGLARPTRGSASVLGRPLGDPDALRRVGSSIETAGFYPMLSAVDNLRMLARYVGASAVQLDEALAVTGIADTGRKPYRAFSLGMKQRLALAVALLGSPLLLILDEPTNGLDPLGVATLREVLRRRADSGVSIFLSSHQLGEVQSICDDVTILHRGQVRAQGSINDVLGSSDAAHELVCVIEVDDPQRAAELLTTHGRFSVAAIDGQRISVPLVERGDSGSVNQILTSGGLSVTGVTLTERDLESVLMAIASEQR